MSVQLNWRRQKRVNRTLFVSCIVFVFFSSFLSVSTCVAVNQHVRHASDATKHAYTTIRCCCFLCF